MSKELVGALNALETEKGINKDVIIDAMKAALVSAYKRNYNQAQNVEVDFDDKKGNFHVYKVREVVPEVADDRLEVSLEDAQEINKGYEVGDHINTEVTPSDFGRIAAQTAKQVVMQRVREAERNNVYDEFSQYQDEVMTGVVQRSDNRFVYVSIGRVEAVMGRFDQMPGETYQPQDRIKVYVSKVENTTKGPQIFVSRTNPGLVKRLFEQEVPEIYDGTVEVVSIAREAGDRTKIAVKSENPDVDPVGTTVGPQGQRVQAVVDELNGENIDVVKWEKDPSDYIANALNPAEVIAVQFDDEENPKSCIVIVPDYHLSLAIGKRGQNARLAAKLTGFKIDIKPESEVEFVDDSSNDTDDDATDSDADTSDSSSDDESKDDNSKESD